MALATASHGGNRKEQAAPPHYPSLSRGQVEDGSDGVDEQTVDPIDGPLAHRFIGHGPRVHSVPLHPHGRSNGTQCTATQRGCSSRQASEGAYTSRERTRGSGHNVGILCGVQQVDNHS